MTDQDLADILALQEKLKALDSEKGILEDKLQALMDADWSSKSDAATPSGTDIVDGLYFGNKPRSREDRIDVYRRVTAARTGELPLRWISTAGGPAARRGWTPSLPGFFVDLETDLSATEADISAALEAAGKGEYPPFPFPRRGTMGTDSVAGEQRPVRALEAATLRRSQVLLGAPGSGKTTFLSLLAHALAIGDTQYLEGWPAAELNHLPVFVILRDYAAWIDADGATQETGASALWGFILHDLCERNLEFVEDSLSDALQMGELVLLLDGLDEAPSNLLSQVRESIQDFHQQYAGCRILITCRPLAYQEQDWQLPEGLFPKTTLLPYDSRRIDQFIGIWYRQTIGDSRSLLNLAERKAKGLQPVVHRPDLGQLASNPMLLTLMALVYATGAEVPDTRARLYEQTIGVLLWRWEHDIQGRGRGPGLTDLLRTAKRNRSDLIGLLERLAFEICAGAEETSGITDEERGLISGIEEQDLTTALRRLHPNKSLDWAQRIVDMLKLHVGLLVEAQPGVYSFLHRSFREYLAGAHLAHFLDFPERAAAFVAVDGDWDETILHAVGFLVHNQREVERPRLLAELLCPPQAPSDDLGWRKMWLAGEVLLEIGPSRVCDTEPGARLLKQVCNRLAALVERGVLQTRQRARVGDVLGALGDGRFDNGRYRMPAHFRGTREKAIGLVAVPAGPFVMGSHDGDPESEPNEIGNPPEQSIDYRYWIARYPVTVGEFAMFIKAGGYAAAEWWTESGLEWHWEQERTEPDGWAEQSAFKNRPVVGISWFEAIAYARWLDMHLRRHRGHIPTDYQIRLPTEAEWEKGARGSEGRRYAWGEEWTDGRANVAECAGRAVTVGMFPEGETPSGVQDMSGNVWEWCLSQYRPYPYASRDGRNTSETDGVRTLRGGSWLQDRNSARCACRLGLEPDRSDRDLGFRLTLSIMESFV